MNAPAITCRLWIPGDPPAPPRALAALAELIAGLAEPAEAPFRWSFCCDLGDAGFVNLGIAVDPAQLTDHERHTILSTAARLANWSYT